MRESAGPALMEAPSCGQGGEKARSGFPPPARQRCRWEWVLLTEVFEFFEFFELFEFELRDQLWEAQLATPSVRW